MSSANWSDLRDAILDFQAQRTLVEDLGEYVQVTSPLLDRHNDHIQFYVRRTDNGYELTDDGHTLTELEQSGVDASKGNRAETLATILRGFGVRNADGALVVTATAHDVGWKAHALVQAALAVDGMHVMSRSRVQQLFIEDVQRFLLQAEVPFEQGVQMTGKSSLNHRVHFYVPATDERPTEFIQAVAKPTRRVVTNEIFLVEDLRHLFGRLKPFAVLNDSQPIPEDLYRALEEYEIRGIPWSERDALPDELLSARA